jgi:molybdopterin synthase catalytic subunit
MRNRIKVQVTANPILASEFMIGEAPSGHGASLLFFGIVRRENLGRNVLAVAYDAYPPLAEKVLRSICEEAQVNWGEDLEIKLLHRTGKLSVGEISLAIAVSSKHRDESYQASRYVIEELKRRAPVWKKEFYDDGESDWLEGHALCSLDADHAKKPPLNSTQPK